MRALSPALARQVAAVSYANRARPPRTLTELEARRLLHVSGARAPHYDDHVLFALALGTGLRIFEIAALDCADIYNDRGHARTRVQLRVFKGSAGGERVPQEIMIADGLRAKLDKFVSWKRARRQPFTMQGAPLFSCALGTGRRVRVPLGSAYLRDDGSIRRLSRRRISERWHKWRAIADLSPKLTFHALRHTFCQRLYESTRDVRLVQRAARHANVTTTAIYASASADDVLAAVKGTEL